MRTRLVIGIALLIGCSHVGCIVQPPLVVGSGVIVGESYDFADFARLQVHGVMDVTVLQGEGFAVEISADDNLIEYIRVEQHNDELQIGLSQPLRLQDTSMVCVVHLPKLSRAEVNGVSRLYVKSLEVDRLELELTGASRVEGEVFARDLSLNITGADRAELSGNAERLEATVNGASTANLDQLVVAQETSVEATGASRARVRTNGELSMVASGASTIAFNGEPRVTRSETHGASSIRPE